MTSNHNQPETYVPPVVPAGHGDVGQATAIEQSRAIAEVQGAIVVAQRVPRSVPNAVEAMRETCQQPGLANRAFFRYSRGGGQITGPSIHLARELARCWGNVQYGLVELSRDDSKGESQMLAFAWDVQTNTRASTTFIVKHGRDTRDGVKPLTDLRDIYESNANNGARRLREQIFAILPKWFTEEAQDRCRATLENGGGKPLPARIADLVAAFAEIGVHVDQLERKIGRARASWNAQDVAALQVIGKSVKVGESRVEDEFPDDRVTVDEIRAQAAPAQEPRPQNRSRNVKRQPEPAADEAGPTDEDIAALNAEAAADAARDNTPVSALFGGDQEG